MASTASAWIFQAQPGDWDVDRYLADLRGRRVEARMHWLVTRPTMWLRLYDVN